MARDLVRTRRYQKKFMVMKANIQAVSLKIQTLKSQNAMGQAMKGVTKAMQNMNRCDCFCLLLFNYCKILLKKNCLFNFLDLLKIN